MWTLELLGYGLLLYHFMLPVPRRRYIIWLSLIHIYGQYTSASDYFTVGRTNVTTDNIKNAFTSTTVTVSYTHLDVYKRQLVCRFCKSENQMMPVTVRISKACLYQIDS